MAAPQPNIPLGGNDALAPGTGRTVATKEALTRLRSVANNQDLADLIPVELCRAGFGRVLFSLIRHNTWIARSAHAAGDEELAAKLLETGRAHPRRLCHPLPETAMIHSKKPILIERPQADPTVNARLVAVVKSNVYIAAPVYVWQTPVGLLHADAPSDEGDVGPDDRDILGIFAEGLGTIMERNIVLERLQSLRTGAEEHRRVLEDLTDFAEGYLVGLEPEICDSAPHDIAQQLTRRELQVLNLLAAGKTNAQIAGRLFISEGTVKSHLRHIMDRLGARNRTEAVARYRGLSGSYPPFGEKT